jgi:hypothetical protein
MFNNNENINKNNIDNNIIFKELLNRQLKNIAVDKKLNYNDIKRISKFLNKTIFDNECSLWNGYITNNNNFNKGTYINFYFNKKKIALHRLLFMNFKDSIESDEYIKYTCNNKGKCCNINHMIKCKYNNIKKNNKSKKNNDEFINFNTDKNKLTIEF